MTTIDASAFDDGTKTTGSDPIDVDGKSGPDSECNLSESRNKIRDSLTIWAYDIYPNLNNQTH